MAVDYDDMVEMPTLTGEAILTNLRSRFQRDCIFTYISNIVVKINPYKALASDDDEDAIIALYQPGASTSQRHPHHFAVARDAFMAILPSTGAIAPTSLRDQAILISGESGAGKTESTNAILRYFAHSSRKLRTKQAVPAAEELKQRQQRAFAKHDSQVETALVLAGPILESFGNACTLRNNNSSRFGKWVSIQFQRGSGKICGASIVKYLLEEGRVTNQARGERNFNIFYQLLAGLRQELWRRPTDPPAVRSGEAEQRGWEPWMWHFLNGGAPIGQQLPDVCFTLPGVDDGERLREVQEAMEKLGFQHSERQGVFQLAQAILYLGNATFAKASDGKASLLRGLGSASVASCAALLGVTSEGLEQCLLVKVITSGHGTVIQMPLSEEGAADVRDSVARTLYGGLFTWLVHRINKAIRTALRPSEGRDTNSPPKPKLQKQAKQSDEPPVSIGVLDIFGFEVFDRNSLDQLCINYANEKLQQHFLQSVFQLEQKLYQDEGLSVSVLEYADNAGCLSLVEDKPFGILALLADELNMPKGSDEGFLSKLNKQHGEDKQPYFFSQKLTASQTFGINHYAQAVNYSVAGFLDKARVSPLSEGLLTLFLHSNVPLVQAIFGLLSMAGAGPGLSQSERNLPSAKGKEQLAEPGRRISGGPPRRRSSSSASSRSLASSFHTSLTLLMHSISRADSHYVRCLKPNAFKQAGVFDSGILMRQLKTSGLLDAVSVRKMGYSYRMKFEEFRVRFAELAATGETKQEADGTSGLCASILSQLPVQEQADTAKRRWACGSTMAFWDRDVQQALESALDAMAKTKQEAVKAIQGTCRTHLAKQTVLTLESKRREREAAEAAERERKRKEEEKKRKEEEERRAEEERIRKEKEQRKVREEERKEEEQRKTAEERKRQAEERRRQEEDRSRKEQEELKSKQEEEISRREQDEQKKEQEAKQEENRIRREQEEEKKRNEQRANQEEGRIRREQEEQVQEAKQLQEQKRKAEEQQRAVEAMARGQLGQSGNHQSVVNASVAQTATEVALQQLTRIASKYSADSVDVHAAATDEALHTALIGALMAGATERQVDFARRLITHAEQLEKTQTKQEGQFQPQSAVLASLSSSIDSLPEEDLLLLQKQQQKQGEQYQEQTSTAPKGHRGPKKVRIEALSKQERQRQKLQKQANRKGTLVKVTLKRHEAGFGTAGAGAMAEGTMYAGGGTLHGLNDSMVIPAMVTALNQEHLDGLGDPEDFEDVKVISHQDAEEDTEQTGTFKTMTLARGQAENLIEMRHEFEETWEGESDGLLELEVDNSSIPEDLTSRSNTPLKRIVLEARVKKSEHEIEANEIDLADQEKCCVIL
eukprot:gb/GEZN01000513.1/.p1 GENE.gb/GEZN01000513.1/~~gb/GEZN01000513.1/.p1  ORF type:complete len:1343 (+),score=363.26 gb/GEZN01000513.1/:142-4170(+)